MGIYYVSPEKQIQEQTLKTRSSQKENSRLDEDVEKQAHFLSLFMGKVVCGQVNNGMVIPKKFNLELPYYPSVPLLGIYPKEEKVGI